MLVQHRSRFTVHQQSVLIRICRKFPGFVGTHVRSAVLGLAGFPLVAERVFSNSPAGTAERFLRWRMGTSRRNLVESSGGRLRHASSMMDKSDVRQHWASFLSGHELVTESPVGKGPGWTAEDEEAIQAHRGRRRGQGMPRRSRTVAPCSGLAGRDQSVCIGSGSRQSDLAVQEWRAQRSHCPTEAPRCRVPSLAWLSSMATARRVQGAGAAVAVQGSRSNLRQQSRSHSIDATEAATPPFPRRVIGRMLSAPVIVPASLLECLRIDADVSHSRTCANIEYWFADLCRPELLSKNRPSGSPRYGPRLTLTNPRLHLAWVNAPAREERLLWMHLYPSPPAASALPRHRSLLDIFELPRSGDSCGALHSTAARP
jgi:hypothetical protein